MANLFFKKLFGQVPSTEKYVSKYNSLRKEMNDFDAFTESDKLKRYHKLEDLINSSSHQNAKQELINLKYQGSAEHITEQEFNLLLKNRDLQLYLQVKSGDELQKFESISESENYLKYIEFKQIIESGEINNIKQQLKQEHKEELQLEKKLKSLASNSTIKKYFKTINSEQYSIYQSINNSDKLAQHQNLTVAVNQFNYKQITKENEAEFKTEIENQQRLKELNNDSQLKSYFAFSKKGLPEFVETTKKSAILNEYNNLKEYIESDDHTKKLESTTFETTQAAQLEQEYITLQKHPEIVFHDKFGKSKKYKAYININGGQDLNRYLELKNELDSTEFKERKAYLLDNKKYEKTEGFQLEQEFSALQKDNEIVWYQQSLKTDKFAEIRVWNPVFEENFSEINKDKWLTIPFQGMLNLQGKSYVPEGNMQFHTDGKNLQIENNALHIETRQESCSGLRWQESSGFKNRDFDYTSGIVNTGHNFRTNKGRIDVLARMTAHKEVIHAASLKADTIAPHIDLFCSGNKKGIKARLFLSNRNKPDFEETISGLNFDSSYLYSLEWEENQLTWKINGVQVAEYKGNLPKNALYLSLSSVLINKPTTLPAHLIIDSVRIYERQK
ncbi:MAG: family 16 glycosylhydrolase [Salinivirgaceae bacterium]|nr:family 16 glycosylhydrolase [Salinivirgaceae bacterium]MDD4746167.1 family 16 glycosylhydrolase [Salinivirgaceae bacterium]MDY0280411.1 family 16 glycosylhydrolase [Salinivirgaceae bacterium]